MKNPCQPTIDQYHCCLLFPKSWSITFTTRSCYIYRLRTQLVINNGASVQKKHSPCTSLSYGWLAQITWDRSWHWSRFFDLTKVFDTVPHRALLEKLTSIGLNKYLIKLVASYLTGKKQQVVVNGSCSNFLPIISGVSQGSVLGPLLFIIYIKMR